MDADRAPSLMYLSRHGRPLELIAANVTVLGGTPSTITTTLSIPGETPVVRTHRWPAECANQTCRITVPVNANTLGLGTGWHTYQLEVSATISGTPYTSVDSGGLAIVNRYSSRFGRGWWVSGVEQVVSVAGDTTRKLWVGPDGSTRLYKKPSLGSSIYLVVHPVDRPDTLQRVASNDWRRLLPNGAYTKFNNAGQHIATVNTLGRTTSFYWSSSALDSITVPVPSGSSERRTYAFTYKDTNSTKILTSVTAPSRSGAPRVTTIERSGGWRISRITDPGRIHQRDPFEGQPAG
jgi:hypothetical protein